MMLGIINIFGGQRMGKIYRISNNINDKIYVGQTTQPIRIRFAQHILEAMHNRRNSKLYKAMRELGVEHFYIEELEDCNNAELNNRETYYISKYNSYKDGYNSTSGGSGGSKAIENIEVREFMDMYYNGIPVVEIAAKFNISTKTVHVIKMILGMENTHGKFGEKSSAKLAGKPRTVIKYDSEFNAVRRYDTIKEAVDELNGKNSHYYYIRESCLRGNIAYGFRWQYLDELLGEVAGTEVYFNTIFDKNEYMSNGGKLHRLNNGLYKVDGIDYTKYVGESARQVCPTCGTRLNKNNICDKCRIDNTKQIKRSDDEIKIARINELLDSGKNLTQIGNEFGVSANAIKTYCERHGIDYKRVIKRNPEIVYAINTKNGSDAVISSESIEL